MRKRFWIPLLAIGLLITLAAGLSQVSFVGTRYALPPEAAAPGGLPEWGERSPSLRSSPPWWTDLALIAAATLLIASVIFLVLNPRDLKAVVQRAAVLSLWVVAIYFIIKRLREMNPIRDPARLYLESAPAPSGAAQALPSFEQFQPPLWATFFLVLTLLGLLGLLAYRLRRAWAKRREESSTEELAALSRRAAEELRAGAILSETILRCYHEMCQVLSEHRRMEIAPAMTAREFEKKLAAAGIQEEHIERLSRLFEWARYSDSKPTPAQEQEAVAALESIARVYRTTPQASAP